MAASFNLRKFETQARLSVVLGVVSILAGLAGGAAVAEGFDWQAFWLTYNPRGMRILAIGGALVLALTASAVGFGVGFNSAGQKRNTQSRLSWVGFFLNAAAIALALIVSVFVYVTGNPVQPG